METQLESHPYFFAGRCTIADLSLYAYTHVAHENGYDLALSRQYATGWPGYNRNQGT